MAQETSREAAKSAQCPGVHGEDALDLEDSAGCKSVDLQGKGALAQLGERRLCKPEVTSSNLVRSIFRSSR